MMTVFYILAAVVLVLVNFFAVIITKIAYKTNRQNKMYLNINKILDDFVELDDVNNSYERNFKFKSQYKNLYDYLLKTKNFDYYIKIVQNHNLNEITVNSSVKWYVRKNAKKGFYLADIEPFIRMNFNSEDKKIVRKIILVYPESNSLLRYINDCELEFITPYTEIYGCYVMTYKQLSEQLDLIEM